MAASLAPARPSWQDELGDELDVDWGDPASSDSDSDVSPGNTGTGTWRSQQHQEAYDAGLGEGDMSLDADLPPASIRVSPSAAPLPTSAAAAAGTLVIHPSAPGPGEKQKLPAGERNLFSPSKLESMFAPFPPSPSGESSPSPPAFRAPGGTYPNPYATRLPSRLNQVHLPEPATPTASSAHNSISVSVMQELHELTPQSPSPSQRYSERSMAPSPSPSLSPQKPPFLPPEPEQGEAVQEDEILETDIPHLGVFAGRLKSDTFTFFSPAPRAERPTGTISSGTGTTTSTAAAAAAAAQVSTPGDAKLRLFHPGGYDTYTRAHLSGVLDSIGVESATPSAGSGAASSPSSGGSRGREGEPPSKRMRMMGAFGPRGEQPVQGESEREHPQRRRDYVKESDAFMQAIREKALEGSGDGTSSEASFTEHLEDRHGMGMGMMRESTRVNALRTSSEEGTIPTLSSARGGAASHGPGSRHSEHSAPTRPAYLEDQPAGFTNPSDGLATSPRSAHAFTSTRSPSPPPQATRARRNSHLLPPAQQDLNRYISTGSNPSARTVSSDSRDSHQSNSVGSTIPSWKKHAGPPSPLPPAAEDSDLGLGTGMGQPTPLHPQMRTVRPEDVAQELSDRVGRMRYERETGRWVKRRSLSGVLEESEGSEDVFRGIEDFGEEGELAEERQEEEELQEMDDGEEHKHQHMHESPPPLLHLPSAPAGLTVPAASPATPAISRANSAPMPRSALKSGGRNTSADPFGSAPRSVSFSDGRKIGPIAGLGRRKGAGAGAEGGGNEWALGSSEEDGEGVVGNATTVASMRTRRIQGMLEDFGEMSLEDAKEQDAGDSSDGNPFSETPSRPPLPRTSSGLTASSDPSTEDEAPLPSFALKRNSSRSFAAGNATFLTECSFGVAHDALVKYITDAEPYVVHWERLKRVDLKGKTIDSVARLKEFLPVVEQVDLTDNRIAWLTGLPSTLLHLSIASNALTGLTAYKHLPKLRYLNISRNQVESFQQLAGLVNLRELHADYNCLASLDGLADIPLRVLSVKGNKIQKVDVRLTQWYNLEVLDLSQNLISDLQGIEHLDSIVTLNLDGNRLEYFSILGSRLPDLHVLRLSDNRLTTLNITGLDSLRTLYADDNRLSEVIGLEDCQTLHNLSVRNQSQKLLFTAREVRDVKRLYLSGNPLPRQFFACALPNLSYAEFSSCQLGTLPPLRQIMPNVITLVINWNHFPNLDFLQGQRHLQRVVAVGCRVESLEMNTVLGGLEGLRELDLRMNSFTLGWYLPVVSDIDRKGKQPAVEDRDSDAAFRSSSNPTPEDLDKKYRRGLPDDLYVPRAMWRGLVMERCPAIERLDGLEINEKERIKTKKLLEQLRMSGVVRDRAEG
ncbi:hypothetical protein CALVIDRAFT_598091 [Calocera viscosa TUFC12733]|uniref:L domain-like protein n=1 Tax=Calocera viscosa (strain TUFC12733) TaxID=1330018 RepID=A0A167MQR6_CALVF|nr:hypothetical protein CALVIDRAFT_598091 [Calocera viscosa TUFC12733]